MLFFRYLFDISSLRMNPCSPRFVYLFVVLRILVRCALNLISPHAGLTLKSTIKVQKKVHPRKVLHARARENTNLFKNYFINH